MTDIKQNCNPSYSDSDTLFQSRYFSFFFGLKKQKQHFQSEKGRRVKSLSTAGGGGWKTLGLGAGYQFEGAEDLTTSLHAM